MSYAPIAIFVYNRPWHTRQAIEALLANKGADESAINIFSDAPKNEAAKQSVAEVRQYIRGITGFKSITIIERETNFGLARSIIDGVTELCADQGSVIVIEDDLVVMPGFLAYMNAALDRYALDRSVYQISGYQFAIPEFLQRRTALLLPFTTSWGWATWKRAWDQLDVLAAGWEELSKNAPLRSRFNLEGSYDYARMLERQMVGLGDSWAIRWYWTVFRNQGKVLFPPMSLVQNTGFDGSGTHGRGVLRNFGSTQFLSSRDSLEFPEANSPAADVDYQLVRRAIRDANRSPLARSADWLKNMLRNR